MSPITSSSKRGGYSSLSKCFCTWSLRVNADHLLAAPVAHVLPVYRIIEIEWAVKHGRPFEPSPKRPKKNKAKKTRGAHLARASKGENTHSSLHSENATVGESSSRQEASTITTATASSSSSSNNSSISESTRAGSVMMTAPTTMMTTTMMATKTTNASDEGKENVRVDPVSSLFEVGSPPKRLLEEMQGDDSLETPPRHAKKWKQEVGTDDEADGQWQQWEPSAPTKKETTC